MVYIRYNIVWWCHYNYHRKNFNLQQFKMLAHFLGSTSLWGVKMTNVKSKDKGYSIVRLNGNMLNV